MLGLPVAHPSRGIKPRRAHSTSQPGSARRYGSINEGGFNYPARTQVGFVPRRDLFARKTIMAEFIYRQ